ncbi:MAG: Sensors of blue-light using [Ramlibacter sp.]|nr:Sensors of blue-light using [Ramlibacter sp.]
MTSADGGQQVHRMMVASVCRMPGSVVEQLLGMREAICRFNAPRGLRTAVLYSGGWFLQWHEGSATAVDEAWAQSEMHPGHAHQRLIHRSAGPATLVKRLHIATLHSRDKPNDVARRFYSIERERELGWIAEPAEIWQCLSAPCLVQAGDVMAAVSRSHVVAVTSEFTESVDLIKSIGERARAPVSYQRFADGDIRKGEIGAAYVDLTNGGQMTRLQALSRRCLDDGMVKLSLRRLQCLVLLLGNRPRQTATLALSVAGLLEGMEAPPAVRLVGPCPDICDEAAAALGAVPGLDISAIRSGIAGRAGVDAVLDLITTGCSAPAGLDLVLT